MATESLPRQRPDCPAFPYHGAIAAQDETTGSFLCLACGQAVEDDEWEEDEDEDCE